MLSVIRRRKHAPHQPYSGEDYPSVTIVIPVRIANHSLVKKLQNCSSLNYKGRSRTLVVIDGVSDMAPDMSAKSIPSHVEVHSLPERKGKSHAQNIAVEQSDTDLIMFTDVDSIFRADALQKMVDRLITDKKIGCVGARAEFLSPNIFQSAYWRFEHSLRKAESDLGILCSVSGSGLLLRKEDYIPLDPDTGDDLVIPMELRLSKNLKTVYSDESLVQDRLASEEKGIFRSRRRITQRNLLAVLRRFRLLNPFIYPGVSAMLISHKLLRWFSPVLLAILVASILITVFYTLNPIAMVVAASLLVALIAKARSALLEIAGILAGLVDLCRGKRLTYF